MRVRLRPAMWDQAECRGPRPDARPRRVRRHDRPPPPPRVRHPTAGYRLVQPYAWLEIRNEKNPGMRRQDATATHRLEPPPPPCHPETSCPTTAPPSSPTPR